MSVKEGVSYNHFLKTLGHRGVVPLGGNRKDYIRAYICFKVTLHISAQTTIPDPLL